MKNRIKVSFVGLLAAAVVSGLAAVGAAQEPIIVAQGADAVSLDPHAENDQPSSRVRRQIYDTLIVQTEALELAPGLATSWRQINDTTWEFDIRQGVKFHNGELLTAHDVKFTFDRLRDPETAAAGAFILGFVESVDVVDDQTVRITTAEPFAPILSHLAHPVTSILNEEAVVEAGEDYGTSVAIGTGAFKFVSWSSGSHIILDRNPDWWGGEVVPSRVTFRAIPEGTVRAIELETGGVDIAYALEPVDRMRLENNPDINLSLVETLSTAYIGFNAQKEPFDDVRVRQAINHAIDANTIVDVVYEGQAVKATGPISPKVFGAHPDLDGYAYDPDRARQLLAEAGYPNGFETTIWTNDNPLRMQIAEIVQSYLAEVGIDAEVQVVEWGAYLADTAAGEHDMFILGWVTVTADADYGLYALFHSSQYGSAGNRTFWSHPRVDELLDLGRTTADQEARADFYREAQEIIAEEAPWLFLLVQTEVNGLREGVEGFVPHPAGHHILYRISK